MRNRITPAIIYGFGQAVARILPVLVVLGLVYALPANTPVKAQTAQNDWSQPVNLSQSGSTSNPQLVTDHEGDLHAIWLDEFAGYQYSESTDGVTWSKPVNVSFPFGKNMPLLFSDSKGYIHALWIDEQERLFSTRLRPNTFTNPTNWEGTQIIAESALSVSAAVDADGTMHVAYVRRLSSTALPAGIYYRYSRDDGLSWSDGMSIYQSLYFRSMTKTGAHVQVMAGSESKHVYVAWDDRFLRRIFLAISTDGGVTWGEPVQIDDSASEFGASTLFNVQVIQTGKGLLALWQVGEPGVSCSVYFQQSSDAGVSWTHYSPVMSNTSGCPQDIEWMGNSGDLSIFFFNINDQVYYLAWNGVRWSDPQLQSGLGRFVDPQTSNVLSLSCLESVMAGDSQVYLIGCDVGGSSDAWITSRSIDKPSSWFPPPTAWSAPEEVYDTTAEISSIFSLADKTGGMHALWGQPVVTLQGINGRAIYYSRWSGKDWSTPIQIFSPSTQYAGAVSADIDEHGRLVVVWSGGQAGEIYFAWANAEKANIVVEWSQPLELPSRRPIGSSPYIVVNGSELVVAYVIPLNEQRGIYVTRSTDGGENWSDPVRVFDAEAAGWEMVGHLTLARTDDGRLHILWERSTLPGGVGPDSVYYSRSADGGASWSPAERVIEQSVAWSKLIHAGGQTLYRLWEAVSQSQAAITYQVSSDGGSTWSRTQVLASSTDQTGGVALTASQSGDVNYLQLSQDALGNETLIHLLWDGSRWLPQDSLGLGADPDQTIQELTAARLPDGQLAVLYNNRLKNKDGTTADKLFFTKRAMEVAGVQVTAVPAVSAAATENPQPTPAASTVPPPTLTPTAVPSTPTATISTVPVMPANSWSGLVLGIGLAASIIIISFIILVVRSRR